MDDGNVDNELIESELSSEDDFEVEDVTAPCKKKTTTTNWEIVIFTAKFYVLL